MKDYLIGLPTEVVETETYHSSLWVLLSNMVLLELQIPSGSLLRETDLTELIEDCPSNAVPLSFAILEDEDQILIQSSFGTSMLYLDEDN